MKEEWKPVYAFEGQYEISTEGNVRSVTRVIQQNRKGVLSPKNIKGKPLKASPFSNGYTGVNIGGRWELIHRLVARTFLLPSGFDQQQVNHKNLVKNDNRLENLEWCSQSQNRQHAVFHGSHNKVKLSPEDVREIRRLVTTDIRRVDICKKYKITYTALKNINSGKTWSWLK